MAGDCGKILTVAHKMGEVQEGSSVQPWHCFTAMFLLFWAVSAYFDHFLMTGVFCVAGGVLAEIYVKVRASNECCLRLREVLQSRRRPLLLLRH